MATLKTSALPPTQFTPPARKQRHWRGVLIVSTLLLGGVFWELLARVNHYPAFILPLPGQVWARALTVIADGTLARHTLITLSEMLAGLALGLLSASVVGYAIAKSRTLEKALTPYIIASQAVPVVAIAPLLVIWFDVGPQSKIIICMLIVFFPILVNTILAIRSVEPDLRDLMRSLKATRWQTFVKLELPAALPIWLSGLKVGATLSVIGAVVGEFVGADRGLGFLVNLGRGQYDTALVFVAVAALVAIALMLYGSVALLERALLKWKR